MNAISIVLVIIVAFLAGMEGILDEFQFHQPLVACTLIGIVCGQPVAGIVLGGSLQMIAMGWANIGAAVAPDAALASVASAIILMKGHQGAEGAQTAIAVAIPLAVAGLFLTMIARTLAVPIVHGMDAAAENADFKKIEFLQWAAIWMLLLKKRISRGSSSFSGQRSACRVFVLLSLQRRSASFPIRSYQTCSKVCPKC